jgi:predicted AAA+ superfamily ATPase
MQDCFVLYGCHRFDIRGKKLLKTLEKYYSVDLGLVDTILGRPSNADFGHRLENVVYLELLKRYGRVWVGKNYDKEIDFVVKDNSGIPEYFQVSLSAVEPKTLEREIDAFKNTGDHYKRTLLTMDSFETDEQGVGRTNVIGWLMEK